jgi:hypothetical protein
MGAADLAKAKTRPAPDATSTTTNDPEPEATVDKMEVHSESTPIPTERPSSEDAAPQVVAEKPDATGVATGIVLGNAEVEYIAGWKLISVMFAVTMASFLMLLDMSILATVGHVGNLMSEDGFAFAD